MYESESVLLLADHNCHFVKRIVCTTMDFLTTAAGGPTIAPPITTASESDLASLDLSDEGLTRAHRAFSFHPATVVNAMLTDGNKSARRSTSYHAILFSDQPIDTGVVYYEVEVTEVESTWSGAMELGLSTHRVSCSKANLSDVDADFVVHFKMNSGTGATGLGSGVHTCLDRPRCARSGGLVQSSESVMVARWAVVPDFVVVLRCVVCGDYHGCVVQELDWFSFW